MIIINKTVLYNGVEIPGILIGANHMDYQQLENVMLAAAQDGFLGFDTAPNYNSESILGTVINNMIKNNQFKREDFFIQDKIDNQPLIEAEGQIGKLVERSLKELKLDYFDSLILHWPTPNYFVKAYKQLEKLYKDGKARAIGVSNFRQRHLQQLFDAGVEIIPMVNQIETHPLRTVEEQIQFHNKYNIITQSYASLCRMKKEISESQAVVSSAKKYNKTKAQIVLRWHIQRNCIPIFKSANPQRIHENCNIFDFELSESEMKDISALNMDYKFHIESVCCPGF